MVDSGLLYWALFVLCVVGFVVFVLFFFFF